MECRLLGELLDISLNMVKSNHDLLTYRFRLGVDCNVGAPRGIAHALCVNPDGRHTSWNNRVEQALHRLENAKCILVVRVTLAIMSCQAQIDKVPATHVASPKLPYPLPGSGRRAETLA